VILIDIRSPNGGNPVHIKSSCRGTFDHLRVAGSRFRGTKSIKSHFLQKLYGKLCEDGPMNPPDEFQKHATDCMQMARLSRDPESKAM
jgi:hypothetical protein